MKIIWQVYAVTIGCLLAAGCSGKSTVTNNTAIQPMLGAVMHSRPERVRQLAEQGISLNERDPANQSTPMIAAAETMQWGMVETLIDHGADIWAHDQFRSEEDQARLRVIAKLKARGYPFPPPKSDEVLEMVKEGRWLPAGARS